MKIISKDQAIKIIFEDLDDIYYDSIRDNSDKKSYNYKNNLRDLHDGIKRLKKIYNSKSSTKYCVGGGYSIYRALFTNLNTHDVHVLKSLQKALNKVKIKGPSSYILCKDSYKSISKIIKRYQFKDKKLIKFLSPAFNVFNGKDNRKASVSPVKSNFSNISINPDNTYLVYVQVLNDVGFVNAQIEAGKNFRAKENANVKKINDKVNKFNKKIEK